MDTPKDRQVTIPSTTAMLVGKVLEDATKRGDSNFRYCKTFDGAVDILLMFAYNRLHAQWKSGDEAKEGRDLIKAIRDGKPLTPIQRQLLETAAKQQANAA
jgi:hypothetical protein